MFVESLDFLPIFVLKLENFLKSKMKGIEGYVV